MRIRECSAPVEPLIEEIVQSRTNGPSRKRRRLNDDSDVMDDEQENALSAMDTICISIYQNEEDDEETDSDVYDEQETEQDDDNQGEDVNYVQE